MGGEPDCDQKDKGLYHKFDVSRTDKTDVFQHEKHYDCDYFVLDLTHDRFAVRALLAYAGACRAGGYVPLACDLEKKIVEMQRRFKEALTRRDDVPAP